MIPVFLDIETDGLDYTKIHCVCWSNSICSRYETTRLELEAAVETPDYVFVMHNGLSFDSKALEDCWGIKIPKERIIDTFVVSRLANYRKFRTHSLEELGEYLGLPKGTPPTDWSVKTKEMVDYCKRDVEVTKKIYEMYEEFIFDPKNKEALRLEHDFQYFISRKEPFPFDTPKAVELKMNVENDLSKIDFSRFDKKETQTYTLKYKKDGNLTVNSLKWLEKGEHRVVDEEKNLLERTLSTPFNPASPKQRVDLLWEYGWAPINPTKSYLDKKKAGELDEHTKRYGWKCDEDNLSTLPESAPDEVKDLARWITLNSRKTMLEGFLEADKGGGINGNVFGIGAWTHRCSHSNPNSANIVSPFKGTPETPVEEIKAKYDYHIKSCFTSGHSRGSLWGVDAKGIQLRILAHYLDNEDFTKEVLDGDIHSKNQTILGCKTRDMAKTFIYAWILGASDYKLANILKVPFIEGRKAREKFERAWNFSKLDRLLDIAEAQGGFHAIDGRFIEIPSRHHCLAGMLQSAEAIIMKKAYTYTGNESSTYCSRIVAFVHDEFQVISIHPPSVLSEFIKKAGEYYKLKIPMEGDITPKKSKAYTWADTH